MKMDEGERITLHAAFLVFAWFALAALMWAGIIALS